MSANSITAEMLHERDYLISRLDREYRKNAGGKWGRRANRMMKTRHDRRARRERQ